MTPRFRRGPSVPGPALRRSLVLVAVAVIALTGCGSRPFDSSGACTEDGRAPGAYPALEAILPATFDGRGPDSLDSGRNCRDSLGTLASHGVEEVRFAGAIWDLGSGGGVTQAVLEAADLQPAWVTEFYETGARAGRRVEEVTLSRVAVGERDGTRIDALNGESYQTVVIVPDLANRVRIVIVANAIREIATREAHDAVVGRALDAATSTE